MVRTFQKDLLKTEEEEEGEERKKTKKTCV